MSVTDRAAETTPSDHNRSVDEAAIITDYLSDVPVNAIRARYHISWDTLYGIIDSNGVPRRDRLATRHQTVPARRVYDNRFITSRADLIRLAAAWLMGLPLELGEINALRRFGIDPRLVGLRALDGLNPDDRIAVCAALIDAMEQRWGRPLQPTGPQKRKSSNA